MTINTFYLFFILIIGSLDAGFDKLENLLRELAGEDIINSQLAKNMGLTFDDFAMMRELPTYLSIIDHYGCWCYFWEAFGQGHGRPIDLLDMKCKMFHQGYECIIQDTQDDIERVSDLIESRSRTDTINKLLPCLTDPWSVEYEARGWGYGRGAEDLFSFCQEKNPDNLCKQRVCSVELHFIAELFSIWADGAVHNNNKHRNGFNPSVGCGLSTEGVIFTSSCCGIFPQRFKFRDFDQDGRERQCCGRYVYSPHKQECCDIDDFTKVNVQEIGMCNEDDRRLKRDLKRQNIIKYSKNNGMVMNKQGYNTIEINKNLYKRGDKNVKPRSTMADIQDKINRQDKRIRRKRK